MLFVKYSSIITRGTKKKKKYIAFVSTSTGLTQTKTHDNCRSEGGLNRFSSTGLHTLTLIQFQSLSPLCLIITDNTWIQTFVDFVAFTSTLKGNCTNPVGNSFQQRELEMSATLCI